MVSLCCSCRSNDPQEIGAHHAPYCLMHRSEFTGPDASIWEQKLRNRLSKRSSGRIITRNSNGLPTGWLLPIWHADDGPPIEQVYLTAISQGAMKGPHLHKRRRGLFACIRGHVRIVWREESGRYRSEDLPPNSPDRPNRVVIEPGTPAALYNIGEGEAYVLNMPSPPWRINEPDEWPVENWNPPCV